MNLTQLRMFCCVAETGSVARAAEQMHRVPSNITTRLRQLELELGADLFIREKQRLRLSPMGHNFLCYANRILALSEEAMSITHAGEPAGNFPLGSMESTAATRLPNLLAAYHQRYPKVSLSLITGTSGEIIEQVRAGTLATALVDGPVQHDELHGCRSFDEQLVIISCLERPLYCKPTMPSTKRCLLFVPVALTGYGWKAGFDKRVYYRGISWKFSPIMRCWPASLVVPGWPSSLYQSLHCYRAMSGCKFIHYLRILPTRQPGLFGVKMPSALMSAH